MGVKSAAQLLFRFPRWHVNRARLSSFAAAREGTRSFFMARVARRDVFKRGRLHIIKLILDDGSGKATLYWFNRPYLITDYKPGIPVLVYDAPETAKAGLRFGGSAGTVEPVSEEDYRKIEEGEAVVFYRTTTVLGQERMRQLASASLDEAGAFIRDPLAPDTLEKRNMPPLGEAVREAHKPRGLMEWERARRRLVFDQLFLLQVALSMVRQTKGKIRKNRKYTDGGTRYRKFIDALPFKLTGAQRRSITELQADLSSPAPMNRLLQGDVGSGKTVIAAAGVVIAADSGFQSAVMAPTEILAEQHFQTFRRLLAPAGLKVGMLVSGLTKGQKKQVQDGLTGGYFDLLVGTHALIEPGVKVPRLGFAVVDERHKFGVNQRAALESKAEHPDVLLMTATPLPRALVLTQYGDTALSVLDEMPPGRGGITTEWKHGAMGRDGAFKAVASRIGEGERAFVVFPLVEESEHLVLRDATREFERLTKLFPDMRVGLIHGRMATSEKERVMKDFAGGKIQLLVSTSVIEVGIDIPEATVMVVENANRFGLAQLHQLRGRVGRGHRPSWCYLVTTGTVTYDARERLGALVRTLNGFELAEMDLKLRGPGEMFGTRQHGDPELEHLDLFSDVPLLEAARDEAESLVAGDPGLSSPRGEIVRKALASRLSSSWGMARVS